jgi:hypothetical protein
MYLKFAGLLLGFFALFLPSIQDLFKEKGALKKPKGIVTIIVAIFIVLIGGNEIYQEERKITPDDLKFTVTYYCTGIDKTNEDIFKLCPKSFYATLLSSNRSLNFVFNRTDKIEQKSRRGLKSEYYVIYESKYLHPEYNHSTQKIIESKNDIEGETITLRFENMQNIVEYAKLEKYIEDEKLKIYDGFECVLDVKNKIYRGVLDSTYYKKYYNGSHYGFSFEIDK